MCTSFLRWSWLRYTWIFVPLVALSTPPPAEAQFTDVDLRYKAGLVVPVGDFGEFFSVGPSFGVDVGYPLGDRLDVILGLNWDRVTSGEVNVPRTDRLRYRAGIEAGLVGGPMSTVRLGGHLGAGATSSWSDDFIGNQPGEPLSTLSQTDFTGTGGLRLALQFDPGVIWWLSGDFNWSPTSEADTQILSDATFNALAPYSSATDVSVTLGISFPR